MKLLDFYKTFDGCTTRATNKLGNTTQKRLINHAHCKATWHCCCYLGNNTCRSYVSADGQRQQNSNNITTRRRSPGSTRSSSNGVTAACRNTHSRARRFADLLLIAITLVTLEQQQQRVSATALKAAKSKATEAAPSTPSSLSQELHPLHLHNYAAGLYDNDDNDNDNNDNHNHHSTMRRTRLRKRHSNHLYFETHLHASSEMLDPWQNPCGASYYPTSADADDNFSGGTHRRHEALPMRYFLKPLRLSTRQEYRTLNGALHAIDIVDIQTWSLYRYHYKFLPDVKPNASVALKRWYRNMQTYVAAFAYLGSIQYHWDRTNLGHASQTTKELNELLLSARRLLCELETAINGSNPQGRRRHHSNAFKAISRSDMNNRLRFRTKRHALHHIVEADTIDLKFAKYSYYNFLVSMCKVMRKNDKQRGRIAFEDRSSDDQRISEEEQEENASMSMRDLSMGSSSEYSSSAIESFEIIES